MCFKNKWTKFTPSTEYLQVVKGLTSVIKLRNFIQKFQYTGEKGDIWQTPEEFLRNEHLDCDDFMRFTVDVLVRIIGIEGARALIHYGYKNGKKLGHATTVFPYYGKLAMFSNKELKTGFDNYEDACRYTFPDGLKSIVVRDWQGKILSRKSKLIGIF